jgi:hypothetical protein
MADDEPAASRSEREAVFRGARAELDRHRRSRMGRGYADHLAASVADALAWAGEPEETRNKLGHLLLAQACEDYRDDERPAFDADAEDIFLRAFGAAFGAAFEPALEGDRLLRAAITLDDHIVGFYSLQGGLARLDEDAVREGVSGLRRFGLGDAAETVMAALGADNVAVQELTVPYFEALGRGLDDAFRRYYPEHRTEFDPPGRT